MGILSWILFGLIAGALAKLIMPGEDPGGFDDLRGVLITILIGIKNHGSGHLGIAPGIKIVVICYGLARPHQLPT